MPNEIIESNALFYLRQAAIEWLHEHRDSPNAPSVRQAVKDTQEQAAAVPVQIPKSEQKEGA